MPTFTIDLPDDLNIPADWDIQSFVLAKMHEAGLLAAEDDDIKVEPDPYLDACFTLEERKQFARNRKRLEKEAAMKRMTDEEYEVFTQWLLNLPVADEETIKRQDEVREHMRQWKMPW
ncbi:MAG: hypothetical protein FWG73_07140 [Planctomycetaceae bacterium]|nr:hypothetical protein [Planctomycetaceae bacterium]